MPGSAKRRASPSASVSTASSSISGSSADDYAGIADLLLFDPDTVGRGSKQRVFDLPAGASRLVRSGEGIHGIWVNGTRVADKDGVMSLEARPGQVLRSFAN